MEIEKIELPINNQDERNQDQGKDGLSPDLVIEQVETFERQNADDRGAGEEILCTKENERTVIEEIGHYRVQFLCIVVNEVQGQ